MPKNNSCSDSGGRFQYKFAIICKKKVLKDKMFNIGVLGPFPRLFHILQMFILNSYVSAQIMLTVSLQLEEAGKVSIARKAGDILFAFLFQICIFNVNHETSSYILSINPNLFRIYLEFGVCQEPVQLGQLSCCLGPRRLQMVFPQLTQSRRNISLGFILNPPVMKEMKMSVYMNTIKHYTDDIYLQT